MIAGMGVYDCGPLQLNVNPICLNKKMGPSNTYFKKNIASLDEKAFTKSIVIPFIEKIHPGKIEYTHSSIEGGRDIVSFGLDSLERTHIQTFPGTWEAHKTIIQH